MGTVQHCALKLEIGSTHVLSAIFLKRQTCFQRQLRVVSKFLFLAFLFSLVFVKLIAKHAITWQKQVLLFWKQKKKVSKTANE
jgi:hypothetical protein